MRKFVQRALVLVALFLPAFVAPAAQASYAAKTLTLLPSAAYTTAPTGATFTTGISQQPAFNTVNGLQAGLTVFLNVTTATSGTLLPHLQGSFDKTVWIDLHPLVGTASSAWSQVTTSTGTQVKNFAAPLPPYVRATADLGSTPAYVFSMTAVIGG